MPECICEGDGYQGIQDGFLKIVERAGLKEGDSVIFSGCSKSCFPAVSPLADYIKDIGVKMYWIPRAELEETRIIEMTDYAGMLPTNLAKPPKAKLLVMTTGLRKYPFDRIQNMIRECLADDGVLAGETGTKGSFMNLGWDKKLPLKYVLEIDRKAAVLSFQEALNPSLQNQ